MIVNVTLNAALDRTVRVPNFQLGARHRADASLRLPGGKGVNVARALKNLGQPVIATGLAGGRVGTYIIEELTAEGILNDFVRIADESRTSTAVIDPTNNQQTEINEYGPSVTQAELDVLIDKIRYLSKGADVFVLAGSLPRDVPVDFYETLLRELRRERMITAVDTSGPVLRAALAGEPGVVSPNVREAEELVGHEFADEDDLLAGAETLAQMGAETALIHHEDGCVGRVRTEAGKRGCTYRARLPHRPDVVSTVGSGDAFLAGYLSGRYAHQPPEAALALGVACGAANTQRFGAGVFDPRDVEALMRRVEVEVVDGG
jgi:1-phosphofructokinase family hexose kinase